MHGLCQAIQKRGLPRALLTDNGGAMIADEVTEGLRGWGSCTSGRCPTVLMLSMALCKVVPRMTGLPAFHA